MRKLRYHLLTILALGLVSVPDIAWSVGPMRLRMIDLVVVLIVILSLSYWCRISISRLDVRLLLPLVGILAYSVGLMSIQSFSVSNSIIDGIELLEIIVLYIALIQILRETDESYLHSLLHTIAIWTTVSSFAGIIAYVLTGTRLVYFSFVVGLPAFSTFYLMTTYLRTSQLRYAIFSIIVVLRILFTESRSIWIAMIGAIVLIQFIDSFPSIKEVRGQLIPLVTSTGLASIGALLVSPGLVSRILSLVRGNEFLFARPVIYLSGIQLLDDPFGVGLANFTPAVTEAAKNGSLSFPIWFQDIAGQGIIDYSLGKLAAGQWGPHSDLIKFTVELGIVGTVLFTAFWLSIIRLVIISGRSKIGTPLRMSLIYFGIQSGINGILLVRGEGTVIMLLLAVLATHYSTTYMKSL